MRKFLVDQKGEWHQFPFDARLYSQLPDIPIGFETIIFATENHGFISLRSSSREVGLRFNPAKVNPVALRSVIQTILMGNNEVPIHLSMLLGGWMDFTCPNIVEAYAIIERIMQTRAWENELRPVKARYITPPEPNKKNMQFYYVLDIWKEKSGIADPETIALVDQVSNRRATFCDMKDFTIMTFGENYTFMSKDKLRASVGHPLVKILGENTPYAKLIQKNFTEFSQWDFGLPCFSEIDTIIKHSSETIRRRYKRLLLHWRDRSGRRLISTSGVIDPHISIPL